MDSDKVKGKAVQGGSTDWIKRTWIGETKKNSSSEYSGMITWTGTMQAHADKKKIDTTRQRNYETFQSPLQ